MAERLRRRHETAGVGSAVQAIALRFALSAVVVPLAVTLAPRDARADGAFPDSQSILTPAARPREISLVTNFGVVASQDAGQTWLWSCEQAANSLGFLYQYGPAPRNRLFAVANQKLIFSDDATCGWQAATGMIAGLGVTDFFPDPGNADRVVAVAFNYDTSAYSVLQSSDGGATFNVTLYTGAAKEGVSGVEIARSDPRTIYITTAAALTNAPMLGHSSDGGASWQFTDLTPVLGAGMASIVAVDPGDAQSVLLLFKGTSQSLALTRDGGHTVTVSLAVDGYLTSYTRTSTGAILAGGVDGATLPLLYRSTDSGASFQRQPNQPPNIRGLSARGTEVFAATNEFSDGYALGVSNDDGATWQPLMSYDHITAILGCLKATCQTICAAEVGVSLWDDKVCAADPPPPAVDAGAPNDAGTDAAPADAGAPHKPSSSGCAIARGDRPSSERWPLLAAAGAIFLCARRRQRPRR